MAEDVPALDHSADSVLTGEHVPPPEPETSPEQRLFAAVIARCWEDMTASDAFLRSSSDGGRREDFDPELVRGEARRWLTMGGDCDYARDREEICDRAGIDPELVRRSAKRKIAAIKANVKPSAEIVNLDAAFARLLESESGMDSAEIDAALEQLAALEAA